MFIRDFAAGADNALACFFSCAGKVLTAEERIFFREANPFGFILFSRNIDTPQQLQALVQSLKDAIGRDCPILIDQEGGRVQRLKSPHWTEAPAMRRFGEQAERGDLAGALSGLLEVIDAQGEGLHALGINVNCAPVLDLLFPHTHAAIGDRAFSSDPEIAARLGLEVCRILLSRGVTPVIKHMPGHGRARADSHFDLPVVEEGADELARTDFAPFRALAQSSLAPAIWGMSAHILYPALDDADPASVSARITAGIIRGAIGFDGFLVSDDLDMKALTRYGDAAACAVRALGAGADAALYCGGDIAAMRAIADSVPKLTAEARKRLQKAAELSTLAA